MPQTAEFSSAQSHIHACPRYYSSMATEYSKPARSSVMRSICLSGVTPGDHEGLGFRGVSANAMPRMIAHAEPDSLEYSVVPF